MLAKVKALAATGQGYYAIEILHTIPDGAISRDERELTEARIMISQSRWDEASAMIDEMIGRSPRLSEAHWLRAQVYEHEKKWELAAKEYRLVHELPATRPAGATMP